MKKVLSVLLVLTMLITPIIAMASSDAVTITYALWDANQGQLLRTMADEFEATHPNIKIDIQVTGWGDYWTGLEAAATGGSLPDTFWMHSNNIYYYGANGQLMDLTDYIAKSDVVDLANYPEGLNKIYNIEGKQYAVPKDYDTIALWYNKTLFDAAGIAYPDDTWTWDTLKEAARKLTKEDKSQYGICAGLHNQEGYYNFIYQAGGEVISADGKTSGYNNPKTVAGIEEYFSFVKEGLSPEIYDDQARSEAMQNGLCAMGLFGSWNLSGFAASDLMSKNFDCAVLPMSNDGGKASIFNGLGNAIAANTKHPDEAWAWVEYLSSKEGQLRQAELGIAISAYNGTADAFAAAYPMFNTKCYIDMVSYAQIRPYSNQTSIWEDKAYELLKNAYAGKEDVATACDNVAKMMNEALAAE
jgi:multiple sugar transport system substrate-binding protein